MSVDPACCFRDSAHRDMYGALASCCGPDTRQSTKSCFEVVALFMLVAVEASGIAHFLMGSDRVHSRYYCCSSAARHISLLVSVELRTKPQTQKRTNSAASVGATVSLDLAGAL